MKYQAIELIPITCPAKYDKSSTVHNHYNEPCTIKKTPRPLANVLYEINKICKTHNYHHYYNHICNTQHNMTYIQILIIKWAKHLCS